MPISASARKSLRVAVRRTAENRAWKNRMKIALKRANDATVRQAIATIDKAAKRDVIHPNKAARLKSRLMKQFAVGSVPSSKAAKSAAPKSAVNKTARAAKSASRPKKSAPKPKTAARAKS